MKLKIFRSKSVKPERPKLKEEIVEQIIFDIMLNSPSRARRMSEATAEYRREKLSCIAAKNAHRAAKAQKEVNRKEANKKADKLSKRRHTLDGLASLIYPQWTGYQTLCDQE